MSKLKNILIVTGGAGFIGSNLIELLLEKTNFEIISIDNYSSGNKRNHIFNKRISYLNRDICDIKKILQAKKNKINTVFHFAEFSRIYQSFLNIENCFSSNIKGTLEVINFCLKNKIKLVYSATSASFGNMQNDQHLSPYSFTKACNMNLIINLGKWKKLKYEIIYFYNVYGPRQIRNSKMSAVIGVFENQYIKEKPLTVVKPGNQKRKFTHVTDTVEACYFAWKKNKNQLYSISSKKSLSVMTVAKMFGSRIKILNERKGERFSSSSLKNLRGLKIWKLEGKRDLKKYINNFKQANKKKTK